MAQTVKAIAESINIMGKRSGTAMKERNAGPIQEMAKAETAAGIDLIDLNIGPARRGGEELMEWVVKTVQEVTDKQLSLDTTNQSAMEAGLKVCKGTPLINSVSLQTDRVERGLELAQKYNADLIGLLWSNDGMPRDANERIWIDPIISPVCVEINQVKAGVEFMMMLGEIAPGCKSTVGLSNISNGAPNDLRHWLNRTYMVMLMRYGLHSAIADAFDKDLVAIARGKRQDIVDLVHMMMDGEKPDMNSLSDEMKKYAKTVRVLLGESLYSDSWLEI